MTYHLTTSLDSPGSVTRVPPITDNTVKQRQKSQIARLPVTRQSRSQGTALISAPHGKQPSLHYQPTSNSLNLFQLLPSYLSGDTQED